MNISLPLKPITEPLSVRINASYKKMPYLSGQTYALDSHIHDCFEVFFHVSGDVSFLVENNLYPVAEGDIIITQPNEFHHCIYNSDCVHEHYCLWITADGEYEELFDIFLNRQKGEKCHIRLNEAQKETAKKLFSLICDSYEREKFKELQMLSSFYLLLFLLSEAFEKNTPPVNLPRPLVTALAYIDEHISEKCIGENLATNIYTSRSTLYRLFRENLGMTPAKYIEAKRMSLAKSMLAEKKSLYEICAACGYGNTSHFISVFKKRFGTTPHKYEKTI